MNLNMIKLAAAKMTGRSGLLLRKFSPEILIGLGVVGVFGSTFLACKATLKVEEVLDPAIQELQGYEAALANGDFEKDDANKRMLTMKVKTGIELLKLYGPAATLSMTSIACFLGAHNIMRKRNVLLVGAFKAVEEAFTGYRKRVSEELGEDKERNYYLGVKEETVTETETDENGKKKKVSKTLKVRDPNTSSVYAKWFCESNPNWQESADYNRLFLTSQQNYANDMLHARGHLFLNEVYNMLGLDHTSAGAVIGWVINKKEDRNGDNFVDFGILNNQNFVNGDHVDILLDFNVDGVIYDLI